MKITKLALIFSMLLSTSAAMAAEEEDPGFYTSCGANQEKGPEAAEVGLVLGTYGNRFYVNGKEIPEDDFGVASRGSGTTVTLDLHGSGRERYVFSDKTNTLQISLVPIKGPEKKIGKELSCTTTEK